MSFFFAILLGKLISFLSQKFNIGGGSAAPGLYALKVDPKLLEKLASRIPTHVVITGTNGKTTTARLLGHFALSEGVKVIRNTTGSNLERGIASSLITQVSLFGGFGKTSMAIWELDEAAFNQVVFKLQPKLIIFLNVFRDQLDRYGEVDNVLRRWKVTLGKLSNLGCSIIFNGDDGNISELPASFGGKSVSFGLETNKIAGEGRVKTKKQNLDFEAKKIKSDSIDSSSFELAVEGIKESVSLPLPGIYHIYDFLGSFAAGVSLGFSVQSMIKSLVDYSPAFGRFEKISLGDKQAFLFLIKNPFGATEVIKTITPYFKKNTRLLLVLNDNFADGTDVSWIWDTDFEQLAASSSQLTVICSGTRAYDLALRLKYAGLDTKHIQVEESLHKAFEASKRDLEGDLFILPTYTALLELQALLTKGGLKRHYWKEK